MSFKPFTLNIDGRIVMFERPAVMGVLNITPDSFFSESRAFDAGEIASRVERMVAEGVDIIDVGGMSTRPGSVETSVDEELTRVERGLEIVRRHAPNIIVSVDTYRAKVAKVAVERYNANIINDISGGNADIEMMAAVADLKVPYVLTHNRGVAGTMTEHIDYTDVTADVISELSKPLHQLQLAGVGDVIIDPGFGFGKTLEQNFELMRNLNLIAAELERPVLVGISRKSMITTLCGCTAGEALPATSALNAFAVLNGASILRVHDVAAARQVVDVAMKLKNQNHTNSNNND